MTTLASVLFIELVRKDFGFLPAVRAFADKGFQAFKLFKARAMSRDAHLNLLLSAMIHER